MNRFERLLTRGCSLIVGTVFFAAGVLKLMDPQGTALIVSEYFNFFRVPFLKAGALPFGLALALVEAGLGAAWIAGVYRRTAAVLGVALMGMFTGVTLILWIAGPAMDCGCFGEAVHLTHAQSFLKNVVLLSLALIALLACRKRDVPAAKSRRRAFWTVAASLVLFMGYSLCYIPLVDFTPFNHSSLLASAAQGEGTAGEDRYVSTFIYEKNGQRGVFTLDRLPDSTWTFVETSTVKKEDRIAETDYPALSFRDREGSYCDSVAAAGKVMAVSVYRPERLKASAWERIGGLLARADSAGMRPLLLVAAGAEAFDGQLEGTGTAEAGMLRAAARFSDFKTLISLNRSNGGATYFNDGNLIEKWAFRSLPSAKRLARLCRADATEFMISSSARGSLYFQAFFLYAFVLLLIF